MNQHLDTGAIDIGGGGVILFVFVQDDGIGRPFIYVHELLILGGGIVVIVKNVGICGLAIGVDILVGFGFANEIAKPRQSQSRGRGAVVPGTHSS